MNLLSTTFWSAVTTVLRLASGLIVAKVIALSGGPAAVALFGQFQNFLQVVTSLAGTLLQTGLVKYAAEYRERHSELTRIIGTVIRLAAVVSLAGSVMLVIWHRQVTIWVMHQPDMAPLFLVAGIMLPTLVANGLALGFLNGMGHIRHYLSMNALISVVNMCAVVVLALAWGVAGAMYGLLIGPLVAAIIAVTFVLRLHRETFRAGLRTAYESTWGRNLGKFAAMSLASLLATPLVQIGIRNELANKLGWAVTGYWQAMNQISNAYLAVVTAGFAVYYLPKLSRLTDRTEIRSEMLGYYRVVMPLVCFSSLLVFLFRRYVVLLLYSKDFLSATELFSWQMAGDVVKIASWVMAYMMVAKGMTILAISSEVVFGTMNYIANVLLIPILGIRSPVVVYCCIYIAHAVFCWLVIGRHFLIKAKIT